MNPLSRLGLVCGVVALLTMHTSTPKQPLIRGGYGRHVKKPALLGSKGYEVRSQVTALNEAAVIEFQNLPLGGRDNPYYIELRFLSGNDFKSTKLDKGVNPGIEVEIESSGIKRHWKGRLSQWVRSGYGFSDPFYYPFPDLLFPQGLLQSSCTPSRVRCQIMGPVDNASAYEIRLRTGGTI